MDKQYSTIATAGFYTGIALIGFILYVASYPVAIIYNSKYIQPSVSSSSDWILEGEHPHVYSPVNWMIDETPLRSPIMVWCRLHGIGDRVRNGSINRIVMKKLKALIQTSASLRPPTREYLIE